MSEHEHDNDSEPDADSTDRAGLDATAADASIEADPDQEDSEPDVTDRLADAVNRANDWTRSQYSQARQQRYGERIGKAVGASIVWVLAQIAAFFYTVARVVGRVLGGESFWRSIIKAGYKGLLKSTDGADAIMHIMHKGQLIHEPVAWDKDEQHYRTHDKEEWWNAPDEGSHLYHAYSSVPTMWASSSANHVGDHVQAEVTEAMEFGEDRPVFESAQLSAQMNQIINAQNAGDGDGGPSALADGGTQETETKVWNLSVDDPGFLTDFVVPLGESGGGERGGRVVSGTKYYETYPETTDTEEMKQQEWRGRMAERDMEEMMDRIQKIVLYAFAALVGVVGVLVLGPKLVGGGGGGGGGSLIPLFQTLPLGVL